MALRMISGAMVTTPTVTLGILVSIPPFDLIVKNKAIKTAYRLKAFGSWRYKSDHSRLPVVCNFICDIIVAEIAGSLLFFDKKYRVNLNNDL